MSEKSCYICKSTEHLKKDCPQKDQEVRQESRTCYNCQQVGHISSKCPNPQSNGNSRPPREVKPKQCYNCQGDHLARDCPNPSTEGGKPQRGGKGSSAPRENNNNNGAPRRTSSRGIKCYNCGDIGHISKECPHAGEGPRCYKCNQFGHVSNDCEAEVAQGTDEHAY